MPRAECNACENAARIARRQPWRDQSTALVPSRVELVSVHGADIPAVFVDEWQRYWPVKSAVEAAGLDWSGQYRRMQRDARLARSIVSIAIETPAGARDMICLPWDAWHYFWTGVTDGVNDVARPAVERIKDEAYAALAMVFGDGPKVLTAPQIAPTPPDAIWQAATGIATWVATTIEDAVDRALERRMGIMPQQVAETREELRGVTVVERERTITIAGWVANGYCYLFVTKDRRRMAIGETGTSIDIRLNDGDYNGSKDGAQSWEAKYAFRTNDRKAVEQLLHRCVRNMGITAVSKRGTFVYDEQAVADFVRVPAEIQLEDLQRLINEQRLFEPPMFRGMAA